MNRNRLGRSGIVVSDICMGTMTFGTGADEKTAVKIMDKAFDAGIDFFDTAEMYPVPPDPGYVGRTEEIVGRWLKTKSFWRQRSPDLVMAGYGPPCVKA